MRSFMLSLLLPTRSCAHHLLAPQRLPRRRAPLCVAVAPPPEKREFLVNNDRNDVQVLQCANTQMVDQGLMELGELPHICVAGESNAGKSSLINHLLRKKNLARASSVAGKTRSIDMMCVNGKLVLTDLPGLPSRDHQVAHLWENIWEPLVFDYIGQCDRLLAMIYVHDVRWKVSNTVRTFVREVRNAGVPVLLVLSKDDRIVNELKPGQVRAGGDPSRYPCNAVTKDAEHKQRMHFTKRARNAMDFDGVHVHYSTDSSLAQSRNARRAVLRHIEGIVAAGSKEEAWELLEGIAAKKQNAA
ncbi:MAG: hypothetical protein SGPRY_006603, partial [Prymnesium sp.]